MIVRDIMKRNVLTLTKNATIKDTLDLMVENYAGSVVIVDDDKIVGLVTERDILSRIVEKDRKLSNPIESIMTKNVITISPNRSVEEAARIMTENKIKKLPVVENDKLVGIITLTDIVASGVRLEDEIIKSMARWFPVSKRTYVGG